MGMSEAAQRHAEQIDYWNGPGAAQWVAQQAHTDAMLAPVADALLAHAGPRRGEAVLDIGCGCGGTALLLAEQVGPDGQVTGMDISAPMLEVARQRGAGRPNVSFELADAAEFQAAQPFSLLLSRFGVMFFGDPIAAFANLRKAAAPGARLVFVCWRPFDENPWMKVPLAAAYAAGVPRQPRPGPEDPGPFSFGDRARVTRILTEAGWSAPAFTPLDLNLDIAAGGGLDAALHQATNIGAASRALREAPEEVRPPAVRAIREALQLHVDGAHVRLPGAMWLVAAHQA